MKKHLGLLALAVALIACRDEQPLEPRSPVRGLRASASLSGPSTANATVTYLGGVAGYAGHVALAINGSGRVVGYAGSQNPAVSFEPATVLYPETLVDGGSEGALVASGINDAGVISGRGSRFSGQFSAVFAGPGPDGWLPMLPGGFNQLGGYINNAGEVVGTTFFDPLNTSPGHATVWVPGPSGYSAVDLGTFFNAEGIEESIEPSAIAPNLSGANRIIVGNRSVRGAGTTLGVMWRNGEWIELGMQTALDVADNGIVVGGSDAGLWENGRLRNLHPECLAAGGSPGGHSIARGIALTPTGRVLIVGRCGEDPAVWYSDGNGGYICELLPLLAGDTRGDAYDVNPSGQIVGYTQPDQLVSPGVAHAVRWQFTPPPLQSDNRPPVASAGPDQTVECESHSGTTVALDASSSRDPDGRVVKYEWFEGDALVATGVNPTVLLGLGVHSLRLVVTDDDGATDDDEVVIVVRDTRPPEVSLSASPGSLWPPNHKYHSIDVSASATDICDASLVLSGSVVSTEPDDDGTSDGNHTGDVRVVRADGTVLLSSNNAPAVPFNPLAGDRLELRAERKGDGPGRTYTITLTATDHSGNSATKTFAITVPHDKGH
jgi:hypothetical protein